MPRLRADVVRSTGEVRHQRWRAHQGVESISAESIKNLEIESEPDGIFLFRLDGLGSCVADTWHQTIEEAMSQAEFEFGVAREAWTPVDPLGSSATRC